MNLTSENYVSFEYSHTMSQLNQHKTQSSEQLEEKVHSQKDFEYYQRQIREKMQKNYDWQQILDQIINQKANTLYQIAITEKIKAQLNSIIGQSIKIQNRVQSINQNFNELDWIIFINKISQSYQTQLQQVNSKWKIQKEQSQKWKLKQEEFEIKFEQLLARQKRSVVKCEQLQNQIMFLNTQIQKYVTLQEKLEQSKFFISKLKRQNENLQFAKIQLKNQLFSIQSKSKSIIQSLNKSHEQKNFQLQNVNKQLMILSATYHNLAGQFSNVTNNSKAKEKKLNKIKSQIQSIICQLKNEIQFIQVHSDQIQDQKSKLKKDKDQQTKSKLLFSFQQENNSQNIALPQEIIKMSNYLKNVCKISSKLLKQKQKELESLKQSKQNSEKQMQKIKSQNQNLTLKINGLIEQNKKVSFQHFNRIESLKQQIQIKDKKIQALQNNTILKSQLQVEIKQFLKNKQIEQKQINLTKQKIQLKQTEKLTNKNQEQKKIEQKVIQKHQKCIQIINFENQQQKQNKTSYLEVQNSQNISILSQCSLTNNKQNFNLNIKKKQDIGEKQLLYRQNILNLNEIINYMINYLKGYTIQGIRKNSWLINQIEQNSDLKEKKNKFTNKANMKVKFQNFQFIRKLCLKQKNCKHLIKNFQTIADFYMDLI